VVPTGRPSFGPVGRPATMKQPAKMTSVQLMALKISWSSSAANNISLAITYSCTQKTHSFSGIISSDNHKIFSLFFRPVRTKPYALNKVVTDTVMQAVNDTVMQAGSARH